MSILVGKNTKVMDAYGKTFIEERHRHRYEVNNKFIDQLKSAGLIFSGLNKELNLIEIIELENHPWFIGVQFHPELKSRIVKAHPLFREFISVTLKTKSNKDKLIRS